MRLKSEEFVPGQYYHIYNHSVAEQVLFREEEDYLECLRLFHRYYNAIDYSILAYCLMPNHYHILIHQKTQLPVYVSLRHIWYSYTCYYNRKYERKGTLFANKLQHIGIRDENYLLHLCAYIHLNPVKAKLVDTPELWQWSNYPEWIGIRKGSLIDKELLKCFFHSSQVYRECITSLIPDGIDKKSLLDYE
jgi:putative transposase